MNPPEQVCRVQGLTSAKGKALNGAAASALYSNLERFPVALGGSLAISIESSNFDLYNDRNAQVFSIGVGRNTYRDDQVEAIVAFQNAIFVSAFLASAASPRCRGNLLVADLCFRKLPMGGKKLLLKSTDLNVARALNRVANGDTDVHLAPEVEKLFKKAKKSLPDDAYVLVKFDSHRITPDPWSEKSTREKAVRSGTFKIYPCAHEIYYHARGAIRRGRPQNGSFIMKRTWIMAKKSLFFM